ncbi:MAG TPA: fatty acid desaturase [Kofleriaceae bacterium]|nr:fatty acid desaturase [Kofleriaceae bacterium]
MALLRHSADRRALGLAGAHVALVAGTLAWFHASGWIAVAIAPVLACSAFIQLISVHNAMHSPVFVRKRHNRLWQCALSICIGYPVSIYVPVHNLSHHLGLQTPRDVLRTTEVRHRWNLANLVHHMAAGTLHLHLLHFAYLGAMRRSRPRWLAQVGWEALAVAAYLAALALWAGPLAMLGLVFAPAVAGQWLMVGFGYVQHDGCDPESTHDHSRNFLSPVFNWFICDNGYHTAHHNKPGLHWSRGRAAHAADVVPHMHPALDEPSLARYLWRAFVWPGTRLRYDGTPVVLPARRARRELWTPASAIGSGASSGAVDG